LTCFNFYFLTRVADETGLALFPGVLDEVFVFLVGVQDVAVLADVLLAADVTHVLLVPVFAVAVFVLQKKTKQSLSCCKLKCFTTTYWSNY
jgi:hypothetical protein